MRNKPKHPLFPNHVPEEEIFPFGKYSGKKMSEIPASYLLWAWENAVSVQRWNKLYWYLKDNLEEIKNRSEKEK
ncbi:MAG: DUF3820 family protein [Bacteriovoracaceae bacterium]